MAGEILFWVFVFPWRLTKYPFSSWATVVVCLFLSELLELTDSFAGAGRRETPFLRYWDFIKFGVIC